MDSSGLALSPLMATCTQYSLDFCLAWALIGEWQWTSRLLFPVPKGPWLRHGHTDALLSEYRTSPRLVAWARAAFEQGALPSLLLLQGLVPIFTLPGGKMFQSTGICQGRQRPPIIHAYGGAKTGTTKVLRAIAVDGWIPLAASMVGTQDKLPMWADSGLRPVAPTPLSDRDLKLLLSCWTRWDATTVAGSALATWLCDVQSEYGPECDDSPHFRRRDIDLLEATRLLNDSGFQFLPERDLQDQPVMGMVMSVGLRLCALEFTLEQLQTLSYLTVTGLLPGSFPHQLWVQAVQRSFCT